MKYKLGHLIERIERGNSELEFGADDVRGISNTKKIQRQKQTFPSVLLRNFKLSRIESLYTIVVQHEWEKRLV
ncbi:TPA_asm: hypothetical protein GZY09_06630 [Listeria monocytogenes]|nr:hypothetical protein [Listeria monocytogenes]